MLTPISCQSSGYAHPVSTLEVLSYSKAMLVRVPMSLGTLMNFEIICPLVCTSLSLSMKWLWWNENKLIKLECLRHQLEFNVRHQWNVGRSAVGALQNKSYDSIHVISTSNIHLVMELWNINLDHNTST